MDKVEDYVRKNSGFQKHPGTPELFSNHHIEKELAKKGIVVDRWINLTNTVLRKDWKRKKRVKHYTKYSMGPTTMFTVEQVLGFAKQKYDGILYVKSFS